MSWILPLSNPLYCEEEVRDALLSSERLVRLSGLPVLKIAERFFINSERWETVDINAADALCRFTVVDLDALGAAQQNPAFITELTSLIN